MQALKRMEQAMTMATEQQEHMQSIYDDVQAQVTCGSLLSMSAEESHCMPNFGAVGVHEWSYFSQGFCDSSWENVKIL